MSNAVSVFFLLATLAISSPDDFSRRAVASVEARYRSPTTLRATFLERYSENGRTVRAESGVAYFRRPGKMRWEYGAPENNLFLVDGKTAWFYVPGDHTVTRMPARKSEDWRTPLALLAGEVKLSRFCASVKVDESSQPSDKDLVLLRCTLKQGKRKSETGEPRDTPIGASEEADQVELEIVRNSGELRRVVVHDYGRVQVEFQFTNWEFNPPLPESLFHFEPPKGVAIVDGATDLQTGGTKPW